MHFARLTELARQLDQGAAGVAFCLGAPRSLIRVALGPDGSAEDQACIRRQSAEKGLGGDDIACGLDGFAVQLFAPDYPLEPDIFYDPYLQDRFARFAVDLLGLRWIERGPGWSCGHPLFEPPEMAWRYSPEQTAPAVRRLLAGQAPWPDAAI